MYKFLNSQKKAFFSIAHSKQSSLYNATLTNEKNFSSSNGTIASQMTFICNYYDLTIDKCIFILQ